VNYQRVIVYGAGERAKNCIKELAKSPMKVLVGYTSTPGHDKRICGEEYIPFEDLHKFNDCQILIASEEWRAILRELTHLGKIPRKNIEIYTKKSIRKYLIEAVQNLALFLDSVNKDLASTALKKLSEVGFGSSREHYIYKIKSAYPLKVDVFPFHLFEAGLVIVSPTIFLCYGDSTACVSQPNTSRRGFILRHRNVAAINRTRILANDLKISKMVLSGILISSFAPDNFYHCVVEISSQLYYIAKQPSLREMQIHVPDAVRYVPHWDFILKQLNLADRISYIETDTAYTYENLYASYSINQIVGNASLPMTRSDHYLDGRCWREYKLWLRSKYLCASNDSMERTTGRFLYVRRFSRISTNTPQLESILRSRGFTFFSPEKHDMFEQARMFAAAEKIIAFSGAALTNLLFASANVRCLILLHDGLQELEIWNPLLDETAELTIQTYRSGARDTLKVHAAEFNIQLSRVIGWIDEAAS